jgi:regulator of sirC expression with transglutaminase-like and TPR domain
MGKNKKLKNKQVSAGQPPQKKIKTVAGLHRTFWLWMAAIILATFVSFFPMLKNGLTNWDDEYYVVQNALLRGPDWKGIFTQPVVSNYHPLTIITLAFNYALTGLDASSYLITNLLLHLINTALVFYFIWLISGGKMIVSVFTALIFGIHPMHVESVAWISERKDVLYTLFFLLALIQYWFFLQSGKSRKLVYCFLLFALSLLSKPAAIILPFMLLLLDYWQGRKFSRTVFLEKIPFFLLSIVFAIITVKIQSKTAIAGLDLFPLWTRLFFATYVNMIYIVRFFVPYPLSAFHPFPSPDNLGLPVLLSPLFMLSVVLLVWYYRKHKVVVFSFFFFIINLVLVMQVVSIGGTLVAERYTYVPYIGLAFLIGMLAQQYFSSRLKPVLAGTVLLMTGIFGYITFERTKVWKDSETLWTDVINRYPHSPIPRTNRANHLLRLAADPAYKEQLNVLLERALEDCNAALKTKPNHAKGYENRQNIYLRQGKFQEALADATELIKLEPHNKYGYYTKGYVFLQYNIPDSALKYFSQCLEVAPNNDLALNTRGSLLMNHFKKYREAIADFDRAIRINPQGDYYLNRSYGYYYLGQMDKARSDAITAREKSVILREDYKQLLNLQ